MKYDVEVSASDTARFGCETLQGAIDYLEHRQGQCSVEQDGVEIEHGTAEQVRDMLLFRQENGEVDYEHY